jgi:hypothetical protein
MTPRLVILALGFSIGLGAAWASPPRRAPVSARRTFGADPRAGFKTTARTEEGGRLTSRAFLRPTTDGKVVLSWIVDRKGRGTGGCIAYFLIGADGQLARLPSWDVQLASRDGRPPSTRFYFHPTRNGGAELSTRTARGETRHFYLSTTGKLTPIVSEAQMDVVRGWLKPR